MSEAFAMSTEVREEAIARAERLSAGLFPHQIDGVAFLLSRHRAILADDMGLGKTRQSILALIEATGEGPYLVVCPASVKRNWAHEIGIALPGTTVRILQGQTPEGLSPGPNDWVIANYDILSKWIDTLTAVPWAGIVFDEAHYIRNHTSQRSRMTRQLAGVDGARITADPVVYALTGTPLTNRPRDLFPLLQLVKHPQGKSFLTFAKRYCAAQHNGYGWVTDGASNLDELSIQLQGVMLRRRKEEVLCLPPKIRTWLDVDVPAGIASQEMAEVAAILLSGNSLRDRANLLARITKVRQKLAIAKTKTTIEFVEGAVAQGEKVLVFSCFDKPLQDIRKHFGEAAVLVTGATPTEKRQDLVDRFQNDPDVTVFVANIVAGGIGLNLTAARQVVFNDLDWVPANHGQAEDRAYRIGQTQTVNVTYFCADGTIDGFVQSALHRKQAVISATVDGTALSAGADQDMLSLLQEAFNALSPRLADTDAKEVDPAWLVTQLEEIARGWEKPEGSEQEWTMPEGLTREAILALAKALSGPSMKRYACTSHSRPGLVYDLTVDGAGDVNCSCPGFEYRGQCSHARDLKNSLVKGKGLPKGFSATQ